MKKLLAVIVGALVGAQFVRFLVTGRYRVLYEREAAKPEHGGLVSADLLHAIALQESRENAAAVGPPNSNGTRDYGLMQINTRNLGRYGLTETTALDPERSVHAAARLLVDNVRAMPGASIFDQLSVYNAGDGPEPGLQPRLTKDGAYVNQGYVMQAGAWWFLVKLAGYAPSRVIAPDKWA